MPRGPGGGAAPSIIEVKTPSTAQNPSESERAAPAWAAGPKRTQKGRGRARRAALGAPPARQSSHTSRATLLHGISPGTGRGKDSGWQRTDSIG